MSQVAHPRNALAAVVLALALAGPATAVPSTPISDVRGGASSGYDASTPASESSPVPISDVRGGANSAGYGSSAPVFESTSAPISDVRSGEGSGYGDGASPDLAPAIVATVADGGDVSVLAFVLSLAGMAVLAAAGGVAVSSRARRGQRHPA